MSGYEDVRYAVEGPTAIRFLEQPFNADAAFAEKRRPDSAQHVVAH